MRSLQFRPVSWALIVALSLFLSSAIAHADIIGRTDDRRGVSPTEYPFVAELIWIDDAGNPVVFGTAWQPLHARVAVTTAHLLAADGRFVANGSPRRPSRRDLSRFLIRPAGCETATPIQSVEAFGTLDPANDPAGDWMVLMLDRETCLRPDQLARPGIVDLDLLETRFLPGSSRRQQIKMVAFADSKTIGRTREGNKTSMWAPGRSKLVGSRGLLNKALHYRILAETKLAVLAADGRASDARTIWGHHADTDEGNSGGILSVPGRNVVIAMTSTEVTDPGVQQNFAVPYRFVSDAVARAVRKARRLN